MVKNTSGDYVLLVASVNARPPTVHEISIQDKKAQLRVKYGDFSEVLKKVNEALREVSLVLAA